MTWTDTPQQRAILRSNPRARKVRKLYPQGTRVEALHGTEPTGRFGTIYRHVPGSNSQGGTLVIDWDSGTRGRHSAIAIRRA